MSSSNQQRTKVGIFHPIDPAGHVPSGIDAFIRGILKYAPEDLDYTLYGATSDPVARPAGRPASVDLGTRTISFTPLVHMSASAGRGRIPLIVRYMAALRGLVRSPEVRGLHILDFHRLEPTVLFLRDRRPKNVLLHQDMSVIRDPNSDILWRHMPAVYEFLESRLFARLDIIATVRQSAVERYSRMYPALASRFVFTPTWVDTSIFTPVASRPGEREAERAARGIPLDGPLLLFVGRLDSQKDPFLLLESFARVRARRPDLQLAIIGDGVLRARVEAMAAEKGLDGAIHLLGVMPPAAIARMLRASDVFVMSSAYEGMPIAVLEALACGVPVASTDVGEIHLVVRDGVNGRLASERTPDALANAISSVLDRIEEFRGRPCTDAVLPYHPDHVLGRIYDNHRRQASSHSGAGWISA